MDRRKKKVMDAKNRDVVVGSKVNTSYRKIINVKNYSLGNATNGLLFTFTIN